MLRTALLAALALLAGIPEGRAQPSFDCARAQAWDERAICADAALAALDRRLAAAWAARSAGVTGAAREALLAEQRGFLRERRACNTGTEKPEVCLERRMAQRVAALEPAADKPPAAAATPAPAPVAAPAQPSVIAGPAQLRACNDALGAVLCADAPLRLREADLSNRTNRAAMLPAQREAVLAAHAAYVQARDQCIFESVAAEIRRCLGEAIGDRLAVLSR